MKGTDHFKRTIQMYLEQRAEEDTLFAKKYRNPAKNIDECVTHILNYVQKSGCSGFTDGEIFGQAIHYYEENEIEVGKPMNCQVVVNHVVELTEENIRTYFDEHEWININRKKTGVVSNIRLLDIANRIIGKYRGLCENGKIFPVPHYNTCLAGIRAVAKRCGITKHITWHQSRHTAATTIFLSNGVPIETVSSMLGHKSIKTTQIYAKITKEKLNQDMENLAARLNGVEEFAGCTI